MYNFFSLVISLFPFDPCHVFTGPSSSFMSSVWSLTQKQLEDECSKTVLRHNESEPSGATILRTKTLPTGGSGPGLPKGVGTIGRGSGHQVTSSFSNSNIAAMDAAQQRANKALHQQRQQILIHHQQQQQKQVASGGEVDGEGNTPQVMEEHVVI